GPRPSPRRNHGRHLRDRQRPSDQQLDPGARHDDLRNNRQRVHRGGRRPLHLLADRPWARPVRHHLHRPGAGEADAAPYGAARSQVTMPLYARRRAINATMLTIALGAAFFGLFWLIAILWTLIEQGLGGLGLEVFTEMTPPPGSAGGLLNAI